MLFMRERILAFKAQKGTKTGPVTPKDWTLGACSNAPMCSNVCSNGLGWALNAIERKNQVKNAKREFLIFGARLGPNFIQARTGPAISDLVPIVSCEEHIPPHRRALPSSTGHDWTAGPCHRRTPAGFMEMAPCGLGIVGIADVREGESMERATTACETCSWPFGRERGCPICTTGSVRAAAAFAWLIASHATPQFKPSFFCTC